MLTSHASKQIENTTVTDSSEIADDPSNWSTWPAATLAHMFLLPHMHICVTACILATLVCTHWQRLINQRHISSFAGFHLSTNGCLWYSFSRYSHRIFSNTHLFWLSCNFLFSLLKCIQRRLMLMRHSESVWALTKVRVCWLWAFSSHDHIFRMI